MKNLTWASRIWRLAALALCLTLATRLALGEYHNAAGMSAKTLQESIDHLGEAGLAYPYSVRFRSAYANQLFLMLDAIPALLPVARIALVEALSHDPGSVELLSRLLLVERALQDCDSAAVTAARLSRLAPRNVKAQQLVNRGCVS